VALLAYSLSKVDGRWKLGYVD